MIVYSGNASHLVKYELPQCVCVCKLCKGISISFVIKKSLKLVFHFLDFFGNGQYYKKGVFQNIQIELLSNVVQNHDAH